MTAALALRLDGIVKSFGAVRALKEVTFEVERGEIHALVGENGAGKSTLMGIAAGSIAPDSGRVEICGETLTRASAREAEALGLVVVYQNPALVDDLSVLENLMLSMPAERRPRWSERERWARERLARVGVRIDLAARVSELVPGERQLVEIAKALAHEPRVLVLDEPTESLGAEAVDRLMALIRELAAAGTAIVYISHRIAEVRRIAHRITALRDGRITGTAPAAELDDDAIVQMVVGRELSAVFPPKNPGTEAPGGRPALVVDGLSGSGFHDVSLTVQRGEILGLAGVEGNGQREFIRALAGLGVGARGGATAGVVELDGNAIDLRTPQRAAAAGIRLTPADRLSEGLFRTFSVRENIASGSLGALATAGFVSGGRERTAVAAEMSATSIKAGSPESGVLTLSGGNQQKVMFAKAMLSQPAVLLCDEPTRGVDVGARSEIYELLRGLSAAGHPVIVLSADAAELEGLCDTVAVFSRGAVVTTLHGDEVTEDRITGSALRATRTAGADTGAFSATEVETAEQEPPTRRLLTWVRRSDSFPAVILLLLGVLVAAAAGAQYPAFLGPLNVPILLYSVAILAFITLGQQFVLLTGGIDLSVGPMAGLFVVIMSYLLVQDAGPVALLLGVVLCLLVAAAAGAVNGTLVTVLKIPAIIATLGTFIALQGISLLLRDRVGGTIDAGFIDVVRFRIGPVPVVFLVAVAAAIGCELLSRRSRFGFALRASGTGGISARRMGVRVALVVFAAYLLCALFTLGGATLLAAQIGTGDASAGISYTIAAISAVVLGGASISGGRGSFLGAFAGALLFTVIANATIFLGLDQAWQYWVPGIIILVAAAASSRIRTRGRRRKAAAS